MNQTVSPYRLADGVFTGAVITGSPEFIAENLPAGCGYVTGQLDPFCLRVDLGTGALVPYQPPEPAADEWQTWRWDAEAWRWVSEPTTTALARDARAERARRLLACDWTQLPDVPAWTAQAWAAYRQALRDITAQPDFPISITWPEEPTP